MAQKGVTRTGEAYCLSCYELVEREAARCPSCASELTDEVRAFLCPRCQTVMVLGSPQCPNCQLKFKVRALKPEEPPPDEKLLMKLIDLGKAVDSVPPVAPAPPPTPAQPPPPPEAPVQERLARLADLKRSIADLMDNRSQMLERMQKRLDEDRARLAEMGTSQHEDSDRVEAEILALASEMADVTMLQAHMDALSQEISTLMESVDVSDATKERGLAARALRAKLDEKEHELEELRMKEELLAKREEMVNRKIQGYAEKKRQLDRTEENLKVRLAKLEEEREALEELKTAASGAASPAQRDESLVRWQEEQARVHQRLMGIRTRLAVKAIPEGLDSQEDSAEADLDATISAVEKQISALMLEKAELQAKIGEAKAIDEDLRKLLRVLDRMLGQLPDKVIQQFSKSGDFAIYEKMLERFKV